VTVLGGLTIPAGNSAGLSGLTLINAPGSTANVLGSLGIGDNAVFDNQGTCILGDVNVGSVNSAQIDNEGTLVLASGDSASSTTRSGAATRPKADTARRWRSRRSSPRHSRPWPSIEGSWRGATANWAGSGRSIPDGRPRR